MSTGLISLLVAVGAVLLVAIVLLAVRESRSLRRDVEGLASRVSGSRHQRTMSGDLVTGTYQGHEYSCRYFPGTKDHPSYLTISVCHPVPGRLRVTGESGFDRLAKRIGLADELQTGDPEFDDRFYLETEQASIYRPYLEKREHRDVIRALFSTASKVRSLVLSKGAIEMKIEPLHRKELVGFPLEKFLQHLVDIASGLPSLESMPAQAAFQEAIEERGRRRLANPILLGIEIALLAAGAVLLVIGLVTYPPLGARLALRSLLYSIPAFAIFLWLAFRIVRRTSTAHRFFLVLLFLGMASFVLAGLGGAVFFNGTLDRGPAKIHVLPLVEKYTTKSKNSLNYYLRVKDWRPEKETTGFAVGRDFYNRFQPGDSLQITIKPGYFQQEWLVSKEKAPTGR